MRNGGVDCFGPQLQQDIRGIHVSFSHINWSVDVDKSVKNGCNSSFKRGIHVFLFNKNVIFIRPKNTIHILLNFTD